jgi:streptogramin lyase
VNTPSRTEHDDAGDPGAPARQQPSTHGRAADEPAGSESAADSPGADLFKRWIWLPAPVALAYLATAYLTTDASSRDGPLLLASLICLPAQALAWMWASRAWLRWKDWRLLGCVSLSVISLGSLVVAATDRLQSARERTYRVGISPHTVVAVADALWVSDPVEEVVYRISERDNRIEPISVGGAFELAADETTVWVSQVGRSDGPHGVTELRADGSIARSFEVPEKPADIAVADGSVWLAFRGTGDVGRLDARSGRLERWTVGASVGSLAINGARVWVTDVGASELLLLDAATGAVLTREKTGVRPVGIDAHEDAVWVANEGSDTVTYFDAARGERREFRVPAQPTDLEVHDGVLRIVSQRDQTLLAIDAESGEIIDEMSLGGRPIKLEVVGSDVIVSDPGTGIVRRIPLERSTAD